MLMLIIQTHNTSNIRNNPRRRKKKKKVSKSSNSQLGINLNPSNPCFSNLGHLHHPDNQARHVIVLSPQNPLFLLLVHIVRVLLVDRRRHRRELALRWVVGTLPRVLPAVAGLRRWLADPPQAVDRVAVHTLHPLVHELPLYVLEGVYVVGVDHLLLLHLLSAFLVAAHRLERHRFLLVVNAIHLFEHKKMLCLQINTMLMDRWG
jgi:hypothetical protein